MNPPKMRLLNKSEIARYGMSYISAFLMLLASLAYLIPNEFVRSPDRPNRYSGSLLVFIENLTRFPIWSTFFLSCSVALFICLLKYKENTWKAHWYTAVVTFAFCISLWYGALVAPGTFIIFPLFVSHVVITNYLLAVSYAERPVE